MSEPVETRIAALGEPRSGNGSGYSAASPEPVVALVPAKDRADSIAPTVEALLAIDEIDRVIVIDDGSTDETTPVALAAGAEVLVLPTNRGKGGAVAAGVAATPEAAIYVLIDADVGATAAEAGRLLAPVLVGDADMTVGVLPGAGARGGFGVVRRFAARGIKRACGADVQAPLSGQRAVRASLLRHLESAERFGLEVALTIDAVRAGARIQEVDVAIDHRHTGRSLRGFLHRGRQGRDIARALWPRVTSRPARLGAMALCFLVVASVLLWSGSQWQPASQPLPSAARKVVVFGMSPMGFGDIGRGNTPTFDRLFASGAVGAMTVRTDTRHTAVPSGYLAMGAGSRLKANAEIGLAYNVDAPLPGGTAGEVLQARTGTPVTGSVAVIGAARAIELNNHASIPTAPGALGEVLKRAGKVTAVIGNADQPGMVDSLSVTSRPAALALMDEELQVAAGTVGNDLLLDDPSAPFGVRADPAAMLHSLSDALPQSDVVMIDPGDLQRADAFATFALPAVARAHRDEALRQTDALLSKTLERLPKGTLLVVLSAATPGGAFGSTPVVVSGEGVERGWLVSPSTKRRGIVTLTDVAPMILTSLDLKAPNEFTGNDWGQQPGTVNLDYFRNLDRDTDIKERTYYPQAVAFIAYQAVVYLFGMLVIVRHKHVRDWAWLLKVLALAAAAFPVTTYVARGIPGFGALGEAGVAICVVAAALIGLALSMGGRHPLRGLSWICAATIAVIIVDAATGSWLHVAAWMGYSLHSAGRFYGIPNTTFGLLASATLVLAGIHVQYAPHRRDAAIGAILLFGIVLLADGAPTLGNDVGGIITLVPIFGITGLVLLGRRIRWRTVGLLALATVGVLVAAAALDLSRPPTGRTHLGRFAADFLDDPSVIFDTFIRKQTANFTILRVSVWSWMIPVVAVFLIYLLVWQRQWNSLLPQGSPLRAATVAVVSGGLLGFLANDSGPIVIALFFVYLLPALLIVGLHPLQSEPSILSPDPRDQEPDAIRGPTEAVPAAIKH